MSEPRAWIRLAVTAALVAAFVVASRGGVGRSRDDGAASTQCEMTSPREIQALERCLALNPLDVELMLDLGSLYESHRQADRAEAVYRLGLSIDPKDGDLHVRLGRLLLDAGDQAGAVSEARAALKLQPRTERALDLLADAEKAVTP